MFKRIGIFVSVLLAIAAAAGLGRSSAAAWWATERGEAMKAAGEAAGEVTARGEAVFGEQYDTIPLRARIGRMFIVGVDSSALKRNDPIIRKIQEFKVGGVILFGYNIPVPDKDFSSHEKLARLCSDLQGLADYKLMIGVDQEGGKVMRLSTKKGYPDMPSHAKLGRVDNEDTTRHHAAVAAGLLASAGVNTNFAPCVDVNMNPDCPVIGRVQRSFSTDPAEVGEHASYFIDEHRKKGVVTALKHFPGHGSSVSDSHNGLTDVSRTWDEKELLPFRELVRKGCCDMVMVGHLYNERIDPLYPASLSKATVEGLLRTELGWDGVSISDDIGMKAISANYPLEESLRLCINAGIDMIMLIANSSPDTIEKAINIVESMVKDGRIQESRINEAYARISKLFTSFPEE